MQCGIGKKELVELRNVLAPHSRTAIVADSEYIGDAALVHVMPLWKHLAADE